MILRRTIGIILMCFAMQTYAQQDALYSHYIYNEMQSNPAYAGSKDMLSVQALYRTQWVSFDGAPKTFSVGVHSPIPNKNFAIGFSLYNDMIGVTNRTGINLIYAYQVPISTKMKLNIGAQGSFLFQKTDLAALDAVNSGTGDDAFTNIRDRAFIPNFGLGAYLYSDVFSVGIGIPHLLNGQMIDGNQNKINQVNHYFITGAYQGKINDLITLQPTTAIKIAKGSPLQVEGNLNVIFKEAFLVGAGYRTDQSAIFMFNYIFNNNNGIRQQNFRVGYAYDLAFKQLRGQTSGSHEIFLSFGMTRKGERHISPRFF